MRIAAAIILLALLSCGPDPGSPGNESSSEDIPLAVMVDSVIAGRVGGDRLKTPHGVAVSVHGDVYVTDVEGNRLLSFDPSLVLRAEIGGYGYTAGQFNHPTFVTVDNQLNLLVTDQSNGRIARYDSHLSYVDEILLEDDEDPLKYGYPSGVAVTEYGEVWIADRDLDRLIVFDNVGTYDRFVGDYGYSGGGVASPEKIVASPRGRFVVCDAGNSRLAVYDTYRGFVRQITAADWEYPIAAAYEGAHLWVLDGSLGTLTCLDSRDRILLEAGPVLMGNLIPLETPSDLAVLADGRLLISDSGNSRLLICRIMYDKR